MSTRQSRTSRSLSPPKGKEITKEQDQHTCDRCHRKSRKEDEKKELPSMTDKSQQTRSGYDKSQFSAENFDIDFQASSSTATDAQPYYGHLLKVST
ncbi:uncharacterized protein TNCT_717601 [Trichonephila clavata]|uniref:Uncharacterized protein n=1 Tax=Trichonephila clavata TaxID=2740835 RepID=A0A8X6H7Q1_TRICU|nr:uncharacterized protein TNCT_717601 [Trichonephila clavata]